MSDSETAGLFSVREDLASVHAFLSHAASLDIPLDAGAFTSRYGAVDDAGAVRDVQDTLRRLREMAAAIDPQALKKALAADVDVLNRPQPPSGLYAQTVWFAERAEHVAGSMVSIFESLKDLTAAGVPESQRAAAVRNIFNGDRGLIALANGVAQDAERLA